VLLDVMMPMVDGFEVCKLLKEHRQTCLIPVVMWKTVSRASRRGPTIS